MIVGASLAEADSRFSEDEPSSILLELTLRMPARKKRDSACRIFHQPA
jgi:hypothetical protein